MGQNLTIFSSDEPAVLSKYTQNKNSNIDTLVNQGIAQINIAGIASMSNNNGNNHEEHEEEEEEEEIMQLTFSIQTREKRKISQQISKYTNKMLKLPKHCLLLSNSLNVNMNVNINISNKLLHHRQKKEQIKNNNNNNNYNRLNNKNFIVECDKNGKQIKLLNSNWKLSLYFALYYSEIVSNLEIPFDILYLIISNCEGTMRNCDICERDVLDLRFTKGYGCKQNKKEKKQFKLVICNYCRTQVAASYQKVDKNLEAMGMRLRYD